MTKHKDWNFEIVNGNTPVCLGGGNCNGFNCNSGARDGINEPICRLHYYESKLDENNSLLNKLKRWLIKSEK